MQDEQSADSTTPVPAQATLNPNTTLNDCPLRARCDYGPPSDTHHNTRAAATQPKDAFSGNT